MNIPLNDLKRHNNTVRHEIDKRIAAVLDRGWFIFGPELEQLENSFAAYIGAAHCIGVANGTDALELALISLDIGPGDTVATVANAGGYSSSAIRATGAVPLYIDIDPATMNMDPADLRLKITGSTKAVIATHLYGRMADIMTIASIAQNRGVYLIEDCAQAHGAMLNGRMAGNFGDLGCFSFYPTKNLGALGDGGAVVTSGAPRAEKIRRLRQYGWSYKYQAEIPCGRNSRLDEMQAAVLELKLQYLNVWNSRRRQIAQTYAAGMNELDSSLSGHFGPDYVAHLFVIRHPERDRLRTHLARQGIVTDIHYPVPDHRQPAFKRHYTNISLPVTERVAGEILTLPCFPEMTDEEIALVITSVRTGIQSS